MDLQGPKLRVGRFAEGRVSLGRGDRFRLDLEQVAGRPAVAATLPHPEIFAVLQPGQDLLLDDGAHPAAGRALRPGFRRDAP